MSSPHKVTSRKWMFHLTAEVKKELLKVKGPGEWWYLTPNKKQIDHFPRTYAPAWSLEEGTWLPFDPEDIIKRAIRISQVKRL